ncbi:hypothetical protein ABZ208_00320 [Streptomyces sp. NPDC006208]|uniref:hypothetical protein n=1 Tax=Streptomyces sp. NPDC006208 TaxID=3156734 RepID=UPI0033AD666A
MHADIHLYLHELRGEELRTAAAHQLPSEPLRTQVGWKLVQLGLRLVQQAPVGTTRLA